MALKARSNDTDKSSNDEDSMMKSYITRKFKKFMKNANAKGFDKDRKQSNSSQFKNQDKGKKDARDSNTATVRRSEAQLRPKWPQTEIATPLASSAPSTSAPSSSAGGVTLKVNTCVDHIARRQACLGGFVESPSPSPEASEDEDDDGDSNDDNDKDDDASSSSDDEMIV
nr:uncharacterized protein LOC112037422 [Quercus suber]